jgi:predicted Holliday junction resolvase-like endonuclease
MIDGIQEILAICPCCGCGKVFRLVEGRFIFPQRPLRLSEYSDLVTLENNLRRREERLQTAEEDFNAEMKEKKEQLAKRGQRQAKRKLKQIDPVFSAGGIDPQDVKVIFDPVEYLIFHGLNRDNVRLLEFVSRQPNSKCQEATINSIDRVIKNGDVSFETLRLKDDGTFETIPA